MSSIHQRVVQSAQQMFQILVLQCFKKASFVEILTSLRSRLGEKYSSSRTRAQFAAKGELTHFSPYYIRSKIIGTSVLPRFPPHVAESLHSLCAHVLLCKLKSHVLPLDKFNPLHCLWDFVPAPSVKICTPLRDKEDASFKSFHGK